ncbi:SEC-C metal-binding domain-containing protein [Pontibacillus yanchengensis]|uniref:Preprotein translocase subunit SecA n=1 Tax=Pontibacillus yanchengensis Y32 TaxID=1385514 RepID=A0A0A2TZM2_9BACI|nr:SEC-C metal-binding domain-containing protein [Pontibacillus yanchengensis]KGP74710.1 hypothetical protein N782_00770 [Pontibacillus yanchengensis Y32]
MLDATDGKFKSITDIANAYMEDLQEELPLLINQFDQENDVTASIVAKRIIDRMIQEEWLTEKDILQVIQEKDNNSASKIIYVYAAGETNEPSLIPALASLLEVDFEDDMLAQEVIHALIKIGSDEVVQAVKPYCFKDGASFYAIDVIQNIKSSLAHDTLLSMFDEVEGPMEKTLIASALCTQLTVEGIPKVEYMVENGYEESMLELDEDLYCCCVINEIEHPKLPVWEEKINSKTTPSDEEIFQQLQEYMQQYENQNTPTKSKKVGRNEPCPCGSGKKYKKCCGTN